MAVGQTCKKRLSGVDHIIVEEVKKGHVNGVKVGVVYAKGDEVGLGHVKREEVRVGHVERE